MSDKLQTKDSRMINPVEKIMLHALEKDANEKANLQEKLALAEEKSLTDALTKLPNRKAWDEKIQELRDKKTTNFAIVIIDIDHFKAVNDTFGHPEGDKILEGVANRLQKNTRTGNFLARYGGEEFAMIVYDIYQDEENLERYAQSIVESVYKDEFDGVSKEKHKISISLGAAVYKKDEYNDGNNVIPSKAITYADQALYKAKNTRNRAWVYGRDK